MLVIMSRYFIMHLDASAYLRFDGFHALPAACCGVSNRISNRKFFIGQFVVFYVGMKYDLLQASGVCFGIMIFVLNFCH